MRAVLGDGRCTDYLHISSCESGLDDICGIYRALRSACAYDGMDLVDEQNDALVLRDLLHNALHTVLKFAAVLRSRDHSGNIKSDYTLALERFGHNALGYPASKALYNCGLTDTGLTDKTGVILSPAREYLNNSLGLLFTTDNRVYLAVACKRGEVASEFLQSALVTVLAGHTLALLFVGALTASATEEITEIARELPETYSLSGEQAQRYAVRLAEHGKQQMLCADIAVPESCGLTCSGFYQSLSPRSHIPGTDIRGRAAARHLNYHCAGLFLTCASCGEYLLCSTLYREQTEQQMLCTYICVPEAARSCHSGAERITRSGSKSVCHIEIIPFPI